MVARWSAEGICTVCRLATGLLLAAAALVSVAQPAPALPASAAAAPLVVYGDESLPPYEYLEDGVAKGLNVELLQAVGRVLGRPVDYRLGEWARAQATVLEGGGDVLPPIIRTPDRSLHFDFTRRVWTLELGLFARAADRARIEGTTVTDLRIGVTAGGFPRRHFMSTSPATRLVIVTDTVEGFRRLLRGDIDAFAGNVLVGEHNLRALSIAGVARVGAPFASMDAAIAVHQRNPALLAQIDAAIGQLKADGTLERLERRWAGPEPLTLTEHQIGFALAGVAVSLLFAVVMTMLVMQRHRTAALSAELQRRREVEAQLEQAHRQAEEARRAAEALTHAKSGFLANMSHEIRTPMNAIVGLSRMLRRGRQSAELTQDWLGKLDGAAQHLLSLVSDVLDISKIESGKLVLDQTEFNLTGLLESTLSQIGGQAELKGLSVGVEVQDGDEVFIGDPTRLRQALVNLASNALKFTAKGNIWLRARMLAAEGNVATLGFEVEDTGIGIPPEAQERIFQVFEQANRTTTRDYGGTGLGLAITRHLVELMGGRIEVESRPGAGSRFSFTVQVQRGDPTQVAAPPATGGSAAALLRERFAGRRVLVADDNEINQEVTRFEIETAGLVVVLANDGQQAVDIVRSQPIDLVLMDMQMPVMDGPEAALQIRRLRSSEELPIIALTANAFDADRRLCTEVGMNGFLIKPVDPDRLYEKLLKWLERRPDDSASMPLADEPADVAAGGSGPAQPVGRLQRLAEVAGLDVAFGLGHCLGKEEVFLRLLPRFAAEARQTLAALIDADAADGEVLRSALHRLRGTAATLGATGLRDLCLALEDDLRHARLDVAALRRRLDEFASAALQFEQGVQCALGAGDALPGAPVRP
jgi:signal transduction histidine kinase/ActR/RegA family two-component response regulator